MNDVRKENSVFIKKSQRLYAKLHEAINAHKPARIKLWQRALNAHYNVYEEEVNYGNDEQS